LAGPRGRGNLRVCRGGSRYCSCMLARLASSVRLAVCALVLVALAVPVVGVPAAPASPGVSAVPGTSAPRSAGATTATPSLDPALAAATNSGGRGGSAAWLAVPAAVVVLLAVGYALPRRGVPAGRSDRA
jgi:hypothetical protein